MIEALRNGWRADDERIQKAMNGHISFLNESANMDKESFVNGAKFMIADDFHRNMLESQQTGLCYFLYASAEMMAAQ